MDWEELSGTILTCETKTVFQPREGKVLNLLNDNRPLRYTNTIARCSPVGCQKHPNTQPLDFPIQMVDPYTHLSAIAHIFLRNEHR